MSYSCRLWPDSCIHVNSGQTPASMQTLVRLPVAVHLNLLSLADLNEKLGVIERVAARMHGEREELASDLGEFASTMIQWSMSEPQLVDPIRSMGTCVENCATALKTLVSVQIWSLCNTNSIPTQCIYCSLLG